MSFPRQALSTRSAAFVDEVAERLEDEGYLVLRTGFEFGSKHRYTPDLLVICTDPPGHVYVEAKHPTKHNPVVELQELEYQRQLPAPVIAAVRLPDQSEVGFLLDEPADAVFLPRPATQEDYQRARQFSRAEQCPLRFCQAPSIDEGSSLPFAWWRASRWSGQHWLSVVRLVLKG